MSSVEDTQVITSGIDRSYLARHISVGLLTFLIARGVFMAPVQNYKVLTQLDLVSKSKKSFGETETNEKKKDCNFVFNGIFIEFSKQTVSLFSKVFGNTVSKKLLGDRNPLISSLISSSVAYPFALLRSDSILNTWFSEKEEEESGNTENTECSTGCCKTGNCLSNCCCCCCKSSTCVTRVGKLASLKSFGFYTTRLVIEDLLGGYLSNYLVDKYNNKANEPSVATERLIQTLSLAGVRVILNPLEVLYQRAFFEKYQQADTFEGVSQGAVVLVSSQEEKKSGILQYFQGSIYQIPEAFCYIFLKYGVSSVLRHYLE